MAVCNGNILGAVIAIQGESKSMQVIFRDFTEASLQRNIVNLTCLVFAPLFCFQGEIGIFFPLIVLRPLDGLEFSVNQKLSVLRYIFFPVD
jgi:hypothetical protein